ncbi:MAG TPA: hypothetical protein VFO79_08625 [Xanthomonadales bacterium]|nr:hypothetical protein [Xanthomonadales bacterium]
MARIPAIDVMISSRSSRAVFGDTRIADVRTRLREHLEGLSLAGNRVFDVWIHELDVAPAAHRSILEASLEQVAKADVVLVLYTGEAGSSAGGAEIGICHAELREALARRREAVTLIALEPLAEPVDAKDRAFQAFVARQQLLWQRARDEAELFEVATRVVHQRVAELAKRGASLGAGRTDRGTALDWTRLEPAQRNRAMRQSLREALGGVETEAGPDVRIATVLSAPLLFRLAAAPAPLTSASARDRIADLHRRDHLLAPQLESEGAAGPVHLVACHRGVTEAQALKLVGSPDAIAIASDFGVLAADEVTKVQLVLLARCHDAASTALAMRRLREWLTATDEGEHVERRALARRDIVAAIARHGAVRG